MPVRDDRLFCKGIINMNKKNTGRISKTKYIPFVMLMLAFFLAGCGNGNLTQTDAGKPYSDWGKSPTGSAKYLDGDTVLVSIYLEDTASSWTTEDRELVEKNMRITDEYLREQGRKYGKEVNLIYNLDESSELAYRLPYDKPFPGTMSDIKEEELDRKKSVNNLYWYVNDFIGNSIPTESIMKKYGVNSIGYLIFIDGSADSAVTYPYYAWENEVTYAEKCFITLRWQSNMTDVTPDTYAHEILHLFGAKDLYYENSENGVDRGLMNYAFKEYRKDIMLGHATKGVAWKNMITAKIDEPTAHFLGWEDGVKDARIRSIKQQYNASYVVRDNKTDDDYELPGRKIEQNSYIRNMIYNLLCLGIILVTFIRSWKTSKNKSVGNNNDNPCP